MKPSYRLFEGIVKEQLQYIAFVEAQINKSNPDVQQYYWSNIPDPYILPPHEFNALVYEAFGNWLIPMEEDKRELFKQILTKVCSLSHNIEPLQQEIPTEMNPSIIELCSDLESYLRSRSEENIPYCEFIGHIYAVRNSMLFKVQFKGKLNSKERESSELKKRGEPYKLNNLMLQGIKLVSFYLKGVCPKFTIPIDDINSKESGYTCYINHWISTIFEYMQIRKQQQPTISQKNSDSETSIEPDYVMTYDNHHGFVVELKRKHMFHFFDGSIDHQKILIQIVLYMSNCRFNTGFLLTPAIIGRIVFQGADEGTTDYDKDFPFKIDVFDHRLNEKGGLVAGLYSMLKENRPRKLNDLESREIKLALENLKEKLRKEQEVNKKTRQMVGKPN